ncbi:LysR family transcriptional regulator [Pelagibacterium halotolerans]|uniref:LysR family transcriptional regulator n=1 Tax=Pelagibacterium halotolerans TaxID=531813 RepID=UPI00130541FE|nr:LysR family transcriptional regulator [Pelagibacterium halotolerans]QJR17723.1 LysR family transcriptional regulator [Pelagibacterium halotolerans]
MDITLGQLRSLIAVDEAGGFSAAALLLGRTQPAISRAIAQLEAIAGVKLFSRMKGHCTPTPAGEILLARAVRVFARLSSISRRLAQTVSNRELLAAVTIARSGTLSAAARQLGLSQPAISQHLAHLESRLERPLFIRTSASARPAPGALPVIDAMGLALAEIDQGLEEIRFLTGGSDGRLRIGALPLALPLLLPRAIDSVLDRYPDARVAVDVGGYEGLEAGLRSGEIDAIIGSLRPGATTPDLTTRTLFEDGLTIVASPGHPLLSHPMPRLADLAAADWVLPLPHVPLREEFDSLLAGAGLPPPARCIETNSMTVVRALLAARARLAVVSRHQVSGDIDRGAMAKLRAPLSVRRRPVGITLRGQAQHTPLLSAFIDALETTANTSSSFPQTGEML